jgi:hypothetical protein
MVELSDRQRLQGLAKGKSPFASFFKAARENANSLYGTLKCGWHCHCNTPHKSMLQLERRVDDRSAEFKLLFVLDTEVSEIGGGAGLPKLSDSPTQVAYHPVKQSSHISEGSDLNSQKCLIHVCAIAHELDESLQVQPSHVAPRTTQEPEQPQSSLNTPSVSSLKMDPPVTTHAREDFKTKDSLRHPRFHVSKRVSEWRSSLR